MIVLRELTSLRASACLVGCIDKIEIIINETKLHSPNILTFVEAKHISKEELDKLGKALPNYTFKDLNANMLVGVKGTMDR